MLHVLMLLIWWFFVIYVEAVTEIIVDSDFFFSIRNFLGSLGQNTHKHRFFLVRLLQNTLRLFLRPIGRFFRALLGCGYCVSVWVAASVAWLLPGSPASHAPIELPIEFLLIVDAVLKTFVLHRLSNLQHELVIRVLKRIPFFNPPTIVDNPEISVEDNDNAPQAGNKESSM